MKPEDCPRFDKCSAPLCPLDPDWRKRRHLAGEPICLFVIEMAKTGGCAAGLVQGTEEMREALGYAYPELSTCCAPIRSELKRSAKRGSMLGRQPPKKKAPVAAGADKDEPKPGRIDYGEA